MAPAAPEVGPRPFLDIKMPEEFVLECLDSEGNWIDLRLCHAQDFGRLEDGTYVHSTGGSPLFLRCLRQDGRVIYVVDGGGDPYTYRLYPFPSERYGPAQPAGG